MPNHTKIPATREEIAAHLMTGPQDSYSAPLFHTRALQSNRQFLTTQSAMREEYLTRAAMVEAWLTAARTEARKETILVKLEPPGLAQVAYLPDGSKISLRRRHDEAWLEHKPQAQVRLALRPATPAAGNPDV